MTSRRLVLAIALAAALTACGAGGSSALRPGPTAGARPAGGEGGTAITIARGTLAGAELPAQP